MIRHQLNLLLLLIGACHQPRTRDIAGEVTGAGMPSAEPGCEEDSVRPATGAPAEGLWVYEDPVTSRRVAAMVGPAKAFVGSPQVTRRVETLEESGGAPTIRHRSDTASVRLELVPPNRRPAAVYPIGSLVLLASYEPCGSGMREPLIRYLRRDAQGRVATDVLLRREAVP